MADKDDEKQGAGSDIGSKFLGLFIKPKDTPEEEVPVPAKSGPAPQLQSTQPISFGSGINSGPSEKALKMVATAREKIPSDNAQLKLEAAMESIKALEPDATKRRATALAILASQGTSQEKVEADTEAARTIMGQFITQLSAGLADHRSQHVDGVRNEADKLRTQATDLEAEVANIRTKQSALNTQAGVLEADAATKETELNVTAADIEAALAIISGVK